MTLDDAIIYYDEIAKEYRANVDIKRNDYMDLRDGTFEAEQLASWLNELKLLRERIEKRPESCEDVISRQAVKELYFKEGYIDFRKICELPPVTPQQKVGRWIKSRDSYGNNHFTCPFCENDIATKYDGAWKDNYCSNCGAKMEEVQDDD